MADLSPYQFYTPGQEEASSVPWWRERRIWIAFSVLLGLCAVVALAAVLIVNVVRSTSTNNVSQEMAMVNMANGLAAQCEANDATCLNRAMVEAARAHGDASGCLRLDDHELQLNCVLLIANDKQSTDDCAVLTGDIKARCADYASLNVADSANSLADCEDITNEQLRAQCSGVVRERAIASNNCVAMGVDSSFCQRAFALKSAQDSGDPAVCSALAEPADAQDCLRAIESADEDLDGLVSRQEFELGTDPNNPDSDGDGFTDGVEAGSGHDPLS